MGPEPGDLSDALDGAGADLTVSGDAMRWSPDRTEAEPPSSSRSGLDVAAGITEFLGFDPATVRRLVSEAAGRLAVAAGDAVAELRRLAADAFPGDDRR
ncbi:hypothetical protein [Geodermatophilus sp. SYSU D01119]